MKKCQTADVPHQGQRPTSQVFEGKIADHFPMRHQLITRRHHAIAIPIAWITSTDRVEAIQETGEPELDPTLRVQLAVALLSDMNGLQLSEIGLEAGHDEAADLIDLGLEPMRAVACDVPLAEAF